jgi:RES domain-containing protein
MRVWRIDRLSSTDKLSGIGGLYASGRWHRRGYRIIYTASTPSLAELETLAHYAPQQAPEERSLLEIDVPDDIAIENCDPLSLTLDWKRVNPYPAELQDFGSQWLDECRTALLSVPSVVMAIEKNYLINPNHNDTSRIRIVDEKPFSFDLRLLKT